jgi:hypothetical protein
MKVACISIMRNEADILESFVRYHLQIADQMIIISHRSADGSREILNNLKQEGLNIEVQEETSLEFQQGPSMTRIMKRAVDTYGADWIVPLDADEFIAAPKQGSVRTILEQLPHDKITKVSYWSYVPMPSDNPQEPNVLKRIQHHRTSENKQHEKIIIPRFMAMKKHGFIAAGNHGFVKRRFGKQKEFPSLHTDQLVLAHYPVRSERQIMSKAFVSWLAILANPNKEPTEGYHWKLLYDRFISNDRIKSEDLANLAFNYVLSKHPKEVTPDVIIREPLRPERGDFELQYNVISPVDPLPVIGRLAEDFAEALSDIRRVKSKSVFHVKLRRFIQFWKGRSAY